MYRFFQYAPKEIISIFVLNKGEYVRYDARQKTLRQRVPRIHSLVVCQRPTEGQVPATIRLEKNSNQKKIATQKQITE
jgi:hypothetical protein